MLIGMRVLVRAGMTSFNPDNDQYATVIGYDDQHDQLWVRSCGNPKMSATVEWANIVGICPNDTTTILISYRGLTSIRIN